MPLFLRILALFLLSWTAPVGKALVASAHSNGNFVRWSAGLIVLAVFVPLATVVSYALGPRAFVAPVRSTEALMNCALAWRFLQEGRTMTRATLKGVAQFTTGIVLLGSAYSRHLDDEMTDVLEWDAFVLLTGAVLLLIAAVLLRTTYVPYNKWYWIAVAGLYGSFDFVVSADTWLVGDDPAGWTLLGSFVALEAVMLALLVCSAGLAGVSVVEQLLRVEPLHLVAPAVQALELVMAVVADMFVYGRWRQWSVLDFVLGCVGIALMVAGIYRLH